MHHFQGEFGGRTTLFWRHGELPSSVLVTVSYSSFIVYMLSISLSLACLHVLINMLYAMLFRLVIYMFSYLRHPCLIWIYIFVLSHLFLTNMYALDLMHMHIHNDHMNVYDVLF